MAQNKGLMGWVLVSAGGMALGAFGPWVVALGQSVSGIDGSNDGWMVLACAAAGGVLFYATRSKKAAGLWPVFAGGGGLAVTIYDRNNVQNAINQGGSLARALAHVGWGLNLAMIASGSMVLAGLIWAGYASNHEALAVPNSAPPETPAAALTNAPSAPERMVRAASATSPPQTASAAAIANSQAYSESPTAPPD
jgi:hypothetical protein